MPAITARHGYKWGYDIGENGWKPGVDGNTQRSATFTGLSIISATLTAPPGSPAEGDTYIPLATATGAWAAHETKIATYINATWYFFEPLLGLRAWFVALGAFRYYNGSAWVAEPSSGVAAIGDLSAIAALRLVGNPGTASAVPVVIPVAGMTFNGGGTLVADVLSVAGRTGAVTLGVADVTGAAPTASPTLTGTVTLPATVLATGGTLDATGLSLRVATPTLTDNAATKAYVDLVAQGLSMKSSAVWATAAALAANTYANGASGVGATLTGNANGAIAVDGGAPAAGDTVLVKDEAAGLKNGLYIVTTVGSGGAPYVLTRHVSLDLTTEFVGAFLVVESPGATNPNTLWVCTNTAAPTLGTTAITFARITAPGTYAGGTGITISGTTVSLAAIADLSLLANISGGSAAPIPKTVTQWLDAVVGAGVGSLMMRGASNWGLVAPGAAGTALISSGTSAAAGFSVQNWSATAVTAIGKGIFNNSGTLGVENVTTITATTTGTIDPTLGDLTVINMGTTDVTLSMLPGRPYQKHRLRILQGATVHNVTLAASFGFSADITAYAAGTVVSKADDLGLLLNSTGSIGVVSAVQHSVVA